MEISPRYTGSKPITISALSALTFVTLAAPLPAQVVINELSATSSERQIRYDSDGVPRLGAEAAWWETEFTPRGWATGRFPMGHSANGLNTDLSAVMKGVTPSFFTRRLFTASAAVAASSDTLQITLEHDDGVIVYINGKEAGRLNAGPENHYLYSDQPGYRSDDVETNVIDLGPASDWLVDGENLIAVAYHNGDAGFKDGTSNVPDLDAPAELDVSLAISEGATLVAASGPCIYFVGLSEPSGGIFDPATLSAEIAPWGADGFDDSAWLTGPGPIGYDTESPADYVVNTDLSSMRGQQTSVYLRKTFTVTSEEVELPAELVLDWDDGYIAYLNGREFSRGAMGEAGTRFTYDQTSAGSHGASTDDGESDTTRIETISVPADLMVEGDNILAFQLHNSSVNSSDLFLSSELRFASAGRVLITPTSTWNYRIGTSEPGGINEGPGEFSDWVELHNRGASTVDLSGWSLSDSDNNPLKWKFPAGTTIDADGYLLVLADNLSALNGISTYLHASFSLSSGGEDLLLSDASGEVVSFIPAGYPRQDVFHSYGLAQGGVEYGFFPRSTPGAANSDVHLTGGRADTPDFSIPGGFHSDSIVLALSSNTPSGVIYYTDDGTEPDTSSTIYTAPFPVEQVAVNRGVVIRARTFADGMVPSRVRTNTYLIGQREDLQNSPALIFTGDPDEVFFRPHGITTISGGRRVGAQWESRDENDYNIPIFRGRAFERPIFMEFYDGEETPGLRSSAGVRLSSSSFSRPRLNITASSVRGVPWPNTPETKPSWNLYFRNEYGDP
ncbi:lamin tail domain-containing protein, partial [Verrucomicrobiales bacterium]|nr:lamin tail domain-containing protein [Verrucomicrobiales bacterium]